ncbi:hypothetical protein ACIBK8_29710 [Streptomyces sp. NPDC050161]|uniref:hypothetical protein n=1 Tax=Streptomyces sp. NPDC050161 TaxID=3365604 RepID=UPI0037A5BBBA
MNLLPDLQYSYPWIFYHPEVDRVAAGDDALAVLSEQADAQAELTGLNKGAAAAISFQLAL